MEDPIGSAPDAPSDKLLILDLDETLVHAAHDALPAGPGNFRAGPYHVYKRPHVDAFLDGALARFARVAVWTSSSEAYAAQVVSGLFPEGTDTLAFVWSAARCTPRHDPEADEWVSCKRLRKVRRCLRVPLGSVIVVDDSPEKWRTSYGNLVRVHPFTGDPSDDELPALLDYLDALRHAPDIRAVEKRDWRHRRPPGGTGGAPTS